MDFKTSTRWPNTWTPKLYLRLLKKECDSQMHYELEKTHNSTILNFIDMGKHNSLGGASVYRFDNVFTDGQEQICSQISDDCIDNIFQGYNSTYMSYGQSGTGKTHTLYNGGDSDSLDNSVIGNVIQKMFTKINEDSSPDISFIVKASFIEVYKEEVYDLLQPIPIRRKQKLHHSMTNYHGLDLVKNLETKIVVNSEGLKKLVIDGRKLLHSTADKKKRYSTILKLTLDQIDRLNDIEAHSSLHFIDLPGSDRSVKNSSLGISKDDAIKYNKVMDSLNSMVYALADSRESVSSKKRSYRGSYLTRISFDLLAGNNKTNFICCCSTDTNDEYETFSTLGFSTFASNIRNKIQINQYAIGGDRKHEMLLQNWQLVENFYRFRIELLRDELQEVSVQNSFLNRGMHNLEQNMNENAALREQLDQLIQLTKTSHFNKQDENYKAKETLFINTVMDEVARITELKTETNRIELQNADFIDTHLSHAIKYDNHSNNVEKLHDTEEKYYESLTDYKTNERLSAAFSQYNKNPMDNKSDHNNNKLHIPKKRQPDGMRSVTISSSSTTKSKDNGHQRRIKSERGWGFFKSRKRSESQKQRSVTAIAITTENIDEDNDEGADVTSLQESSLSVLNLKTLKLSAGTR